MKLTATALDKGLRLDVWLSRSLPELSRSRVQSLIKSGHVTSGGKPLRPSAAVAEGLEVDVEIPPAAPVELAGEDIPLAVLYEDADIIVISKPAGLVVHPAAGHAAGTLVNALLHHCEDLAGIGGELRPGIVHRLDKDTSGVLVAAKNEQAMTGLMEQFKSRSVRKEYVAVVHGTPKPAAGTVETLIGRSSHDRKKMSAMPASGRNAVTHYRIEEALDGASVLRIRIETGRTHQIRVHMAHIGHPVVGDRQYGRGGRGTGPLTAAKRQMLHAETLAFRHPRTGEPLEFKAPIPNDMIELIRGLQ